SASYFSVDANTLLIEPWMSKFLSFVLSGLLRSGSSRRPPAVIFRQGLIAQERGDAVTAAFFPCEAGHEAWPIRGSMPTRFCTRFSLSASASQEPAAAPPALQALVSEVPSPSRAGCPSPATRPGCARRRGPVASRLPPGLVSR